MKTGPKDLAPPGSFVVAETSSSTWNYHLRRVAEDGKLYRSGGAPPAICGRALGWDTKIPITAWGTKSHIPEHWCIECARVSGEDMVRASVVPALDIMKNGLEKQGWVSTTSLAKLSIKDRYLYKSESEAAKYAAHNLLAVEQVELVSGSEFYVGQVLKATSTVSGFIEVWTIDSLTRYVIDKNGKARRRAKSVAPKA